MPELAELVEAELKSQDFAGDVIELWRDVFRWYNEGGPTVIEENLEKRIKDISSSFTKEIREIEMEGKLKKPRRAVRKGRKK